MKKICINLILLFTFILTAQGQIIIKGGSGASTYAKFAKRENIDKAKLEVLYEYSAKIFNPNKYTIYTDILQVGQNFSKYFAYAQYQADSVFHTKDMDKILFQEASDILNKYGAAYKSSHTVVKNKTKGELDYYDRVFTDYYVYPDIINIEWKLINETKDVCGYSCQKAIATYRGRQWTAYYTMDIPISDGPWKFSGLPGLIMHIEDNNSEHVFTAISVRNADKEIYLEVKNNRFKTTRERYNQQIKAFRTEPAQLLSGNPLVGKDPVTGKEVSVANKKRFFNPIELE